MDLRGQWRTGRKRWRLASAFGVLACLMVGAPSVRAVDEKDLGARLEDELIPWFNTQVDADRLAGVAGATLSYRSFRVPSFVEKGAIVVLPGRTEPALKYLELAYDLRNSGYTLYILDHRGQGRSSRLTADAQMGHVERFENYVLDLDRFMTQVVLPAGHQKVFFLAHSMGGAIALYWMSLRPGKVAAAALTAPMLEINTAPYPPGIAVAIVKFLVSIGRGERYAPGRSPYDPNEPMDASMTTRSEARFQMNHALLKRFPDEAVGGPSARWVAESLRATDVILARASLVREPVLMFSANDDEIVLPRRQRDGCAAMTRCVLVRVPGAWHELLMERDAIRTPVIERTLGFFEALTTRKN